MTRVRFAVAPTGNLSVGGARIALANNLFALHNKGHLLLRLDDLDERKCNPASADQIIRDLRWFGIDWHETIRQADRLPLYKDAIERLRRDDLLYPCFESDEELKAKQEFRRKRGQSTIYDRAMLKLTSKQRHDAEAGGKRPYWRFKLSGRNMQWRDMVLGARSAALSAVSDPVLVLADGNPSPLLASCIDDIDNRISHVIRSEDAVGNIAIQIELYETLAGDAAAVRFAHLPGLTETAKSAERGQSIGGLPVRNLRNDGIEPRAIIACLAAKADDIPSTLAELARNFRLSDLAAGNFDAARLLATNRRLLRGLDFATVADRLPDGATEAFWLAVRGNLDLLKEARGWWDVVAGSIIPPIIEGERDLLLLAASMLPPEPWDAGVWKDWTTALESASRRTGEALLTPLRLALTGEDNGPDLAGLLPLIGRSRALDRLQIAAA